LAGPEKYSKAVCCRSETCKGGVGLWVVTGPGGKKKSGEGKHEAGNGEGKGVKGNPKTI